MGGQAEKEGWTENCNDPSRSIQYTLKCELRRLERHGRGETPYASAIREVLWALANEHAEDLVRLLEREMSRPAYDEADEPYAAALRSVLSVLYRSHTSSHELFRYFLRRLESEGRGDEPFACAVRKALASNDTATLSALLHVGIQDEKNRS